MKKYIALSLLLITLLTACTKENESLSITPLTDYYPLQVGKYITYNLDSTVYINFGQKDTIIKYQVKDSTEAQITDNLGRPAYRIVRYIRKNASQLWTPNNTFMVTPTANTIEFVENNLRFIKLVLPIKENGTWNGNAYLTSDPYPSFSFGSNFMKDWLYTYKQVNAPLTINATNFENTLTVFQNENSDTARDNSTIVFAQKTYSIEKYAKGIGFIYKEFLHWEYQGNTKSYKGFGVKLSITGHN